MSSEPKDPELEKRIQETKAEYEKGKKKEEIEKKLEELRKIRSDVSPKPSKTGLEVLEDIFNSLVERGSARSFLYINRFPGMESTDTYVLRTNDLQATFEFETFEVDSLEKVYGLEEIDGKTIETIRESSKHRFLTLDDLTKWAGKEFLGEKIITRVKIHNYSDFHPDETKDFLFRKGDALKLVRYADSEFTFNLDGMCHYDLSCSLPFEFSSLDFPFPTDIPVITSFRYPFTHAVRSRDGTACIESSFKYTAGKVDAILGNIRNLTDRMLRMDSAVNARRLQLNSLFNYWKILDGELDRLAKEYDKQREELYRELS